MKYTNKWIVVPFSSLNKLNNDGNQINQILENKSLSHDEILDAYNNIKLRKLRKKLSNIEKSNSNNEMQENVPLIEKNENKDEEDESIEEDEMDMDQIKEEDIENEVKDEPKSPISHILKQIINLTTPKTNRKSLNDLGTAAPKPTRIKKIIPEDELINSINDQNQIKKNHIIDTSMFNVPPAKNTRTQRTISDDTFSKVFDKSIQKKNKKRKLRNQYEPVSKYIKTNKGKKSLRKENQKKFLWSNLGSISKINSNLKSKI